MKQKFTLFILFLISFFVIVNEAVSYTSQPPTGVAGNPPSNSTCNSCHSGSTITDSTQFTLRMATTQAALPNTSSIVTTSTTYNPDSTYFISFTLNGTATGNKYGFQFYPSNLAGTTQGVCSVVNSANTAVSSNYMSHFNANSTKSWTFQWKAPTTSNPVTFFYTGVLANNLGGNTGDVVYKSNRTIQGVVPCSSPSAPIITGGSLACPGSSVSLSVASQPSTTFAWSNSGSGTTQNVNSGIYTVTATNTCGTAVSQPFTVNAGTAVVTPTIGGTPSFCATGNTTINVSNPTANHTYAWSNGGSGNSISVSTAASYTVTATTNCGTATASISVTQRPSPTVPVISGANTVCPSDSTQLSINPVASNTYTWSNGGVGNSIFAMNGTYTVTASTSCGAAFSLPFVVSQSSAATSPTIGGATTYCAGTTATIFVSNRSSNTTYLWSTGANSDSINVMSGTYTVTATTSCGTASSTGFVVNQSQSPTMPSIIGDTEFCDGDSASLAVNNPISGNNYNWSNGITGSAIHVKAGGTYSVSATTSCGTLSAMVMVTQNPLPNPIISASSNLLKVNGPTYSTYQWIFNDTAILGATDSVFSATNNGPYKVLVTDVKGCSNTSAVYNLTGVGISDFATQKISFYPNPVKDYIALQYESQSESDRFIIFDAIGRKQLEGRFDNKIIYIDMLKKGIYFIQITTPNRQIKGSFVKQ